MGKVKSLSQAVSQNPTALALVLASQGGKKLQQQFHFHIAAGKYMVCRKTHDLQETSSESRSCSPIAQIKGDAAPSKRARAGWAVLDFSHPRSCWTWKEKVAASAAFHGIIELLGLENTSNILKPLVKTQEPAGNVTTQLPWKSSTPGAPHPLGQRSRFRKILPQNPSL